MEIPRILIREVVVMGLEYGRGGADEGLVVHRGVESLVHVAFASFVARAVLKVQTNSRDYSFFDLSRHHAGVVLRGKAVEAVAEARGEGSILHGGQISWENV